MLRAFDPKRRFEIHLDADENESPAARTTFICRYLTTREWQQVEDLLNKPDTGDSIRATTEPVFAALKLAIVDWRNVCGATDAPIAFAQDAFESLLDPAEARELLEKMIRGATMGGADAKKSASQSPSDTGSSADPAEPATASTPPASLSQPASNVPAATDRAATNAPTAAALS
jgi:hypothetical protein